MTRPTGGIATPILLVGCGKMGGALLQGWLERGVAAADVAVVEPALERGLADRLAGATLLASPDGLPAGFRPATVMLAVKPQVMDAVAPTYAALRRPGTTFVSIAAGKRIAAFEGWLGAGAAVVRAMPNTPAAIGRGITVLCANGHVDAAGRASAEALLSAVGEVAWIDDEQLMDAVTAVSGSGPAYVFHLIECLEAAAVSVGLDPGLARRLAVETVAGAGELARTDGGEPGQLRVNVTSPGGSTQAALDVLMADDGGLARLMRRAVEAARDRGRELGG